MKLLHIACACGILLVGLSAAEDPSGFYYWSAAQLRGYEPILAARLKARNSGSEQLANFGNHTALIVRRERSGGAEFHQRHVDIFIVQTGEAMLRVGGDLLDRRQARENEVTGSGIRGGVERTIRAGDVVHIPARTPHQVIVDAGRQITYLTFKIDSP